MQCKSIPRTNGNGKTLIENLLPLYYVKYDQIVSEAIKLFSLYQTVWKEIKFKHSIREQTVIDTTFGIPTYFLLSNCGPWIFVDSYKQKESCRTLVLSVALLEVCRSSFLLLLLPCRQCVLVLPAQISITTGLHLIILWLLKNIFGKFWSFGKMQQRIEKAKKYIISLIGLKLFSYKPSNSRDVQILLG